MNLIVGPPQGIESTSNAVAFTGRHAQSGAGSASDASRALSRELFVPDVERVGFAASDSVVGAHALRGRCADRLRGRGRVRWVRRAVAQGGRSGSLRPRRVAGAHCHRRTVVEVAAPVAEAVRHVGETCVWAWGSQASLSARPGRPN